MKKWPSTKTTKRRKVTPRPTFLAAN